MICIKEHTDAHSGGYSNSDISGFGHDFQADCHSTYEAHRINKQIDMHNFNDISEHFTHCLTQTTWFN